MKRLHIAISTDKIEQSIQDYTDRLGCPPCSQVAGEYALWRTETVNLSIRQDRKCAPGSLRHLGWEDPSAPSFSEEQDVNGIVWERFQAQHQADEINKLWPEAKYCP
jgi:catechol 2,3-dioxygenase-like lactoylglutathione lyase family enzyme